MSDSLTLKWGSLKGWHLENDAAKAVLQRYFDEGVSMSAALQHDTPSQKAAICELIDLVDGEIFKDWSGEIMSKEAAKKYVLEYGADR